MDGSPVIVPASVTYVYFILTLVAGILVGRRFGRPLASFAVMIGLAQVGFMLLFWVQKGQRFIMGIFGGFFPRELVFPLIFVLVALLTKQRQTPQRG
jgi:hypothetical protein